VGSADPIDLEEVRRRVEPLDAAEPVEPLHRDSLRDR
jgi:hypothetical protein